MGSNPAAPTNFPRNLGVLLSHPAIGRRPGPARVDPSAKPPHRADVRHITMRCCHGTPCVSHGRPAVPGRATAPLRSGRRPPSCVPPYIRAHPKCDMAGAGLAAVAATISPTGQSGRRGAEAPRLSLGARPAAAFPRADALHGNVGIIPRSRRKFDEPGHTARAASHIRFGTRDLPHGRRQDAPQPRQPPRALLEHWPWSTAGAQRTTGVGRRYRQYSRVCSSISTRPCNSSTLLGSLACERAASARLGSPSNAGHASGSQRCERIMHLEQ